MSTRIWLACPTCKGKQQVTLFQDGFCCPGPSSSSVDCPTCTAHFTAVTEAVEAAVNEYDRKLSKAEQRGDRADYIKDSITLSPFLEPPR